MRIITSRYKSTNYYFIDTDDGLLAFDAGWPGTYREYKDCLKKEGYRISDIKWLIVSHFHIDHAGLAGMLADKGIIFYVFENQLYGIEEMEMLIFKKNMPYQKLNMNTIFVTNITESRALLKSIKIAGEIIKTNGHGEQSISLLLDSGEAFIGDLPIERMLGENDNLCIENWKELKTKGAMKIYPSHALEYSI